MKHCVFFNTSDKIIKRLTKGIYSKVLDTFTSLLIIFLKAFFYSKFDSFFFPYF